MFKLEYVCVHTYMRDCRPSIFSAPEMAAFGKKINFPENESYLYHTLVKWRISGLLSNDRAHT